jgi:hypothetical protein
MGDTVADAFRASLAEGEIRLEFGSTRELPQGADGATVALSRSLSLPPAIVLRLRSRLKEALAELERRASVSPQQAVAAMGTTLINARPDAAGERAALLFRLVDALGVQYRYERSFRLAPDTLLANRMLLSVGQGRLGEDAPARVLEICAELGMPAGLRDGVPELVREARCVHFGFEADARGALYKVYFERRAAQAEAARGKAVLLHLAYKWDVEKPERCVTTRYEWRPALDVPALRERMTRCYGAEHASACEAAAAVLGLAAARVDAARLQFLEVREEGNDRQSFDLNVYDAGLTLRDAQMPLACLRDHFGIRPGRFQALYDQVSGRRLGHIAGGAHRGGEAFATVYYGVEVRG